MESFTYKEYRNLLVKANKKYFFRNFDNFMNDKNFLLMRHDICAGLGNPIKLAIIEKELGISSTYFFSIDSSFYNLLSVEVSEIVHKLLSLGHDIGIHFHINKYIGDGKNKIIDCLRLQKRIFENILGVEPKSFSFHNPTNEIINKFDEVSYCDMINTYSHFFSNKIGYCSDSNGYWRFESLNELLESFKHNKLQVLIHPIWWSEKENTPYDKIKEDLSISRENILNRWISGRISRGREIIGYINSKNK